VDDITWYSSAPEPGTWLRITDAGLGKIEVWSTGFDLLGEAAIHLNSERQGVLRARRLTASTGVRLHYRGPGDLYGVDVAEADPWASSEASAQGYPDEPSF
jgi:hypothetical protein